MAKSLKVNARTMLKAITEGRSRAPNSFNKCVAAKTKGKKGGGKKGARNRFKAATKACKGK